MDEDEEEQAHAKMVDCHEQLRRASRAAHELYVIAATLPKPTELRRWRDVSGDPGKHYGPMNAALAAVRITDDDLEPLRAFTQPD